MHRILLLAACFMFAPAAFAGATPGGDVLVLYSNNRLLPANIDIDRGLHQEIAKRTDPNVELFSEFFDHPSFSGVEYERTLEVYLQEKYAARTPRVIVVAGDEALEFLLRRRPGLFPDVPVVHLAVGPATLRKIAPLPVDVVGVDAGYDPLGTIQLAMQLHPDARRLVVVTGASVPDRERESSLRAGIPQLGLQQSVEHIAGESNEEVMKRLAALGSDDVVYSPGYFRDGAGRELAPRDSVELMAAVSHAPVYGPYNTFIGTGAVGGRMPDFADMGRQAAIAVNRLLDGVAPADLGLPAEAAARVNLDWRQVPRWDIDPERIPADAVLHFKEPSFWEVHRDKAIMIAAVIILQAVLIAALLIERRQRQQTAVALKASEAQMSLAGRAARLSMWVWDIAPPRDGKANGGSSVVPALPLEQLLATVHPADRDRFERAVRQAVALNDELELEYRSVRADGEVSWIAARGRAEKSGDRLAGVAMDITARKAAEQQAEKDRSALAHLSRISMMGQLSISIAHQLNQPLAAILGNAEAARKMLDHGTPDIVELKEICDDIVAQDNRATEVIRRLGALYKRGELKVANLNLNELVCETLDLVHAELMTRQVTPAIELAPSPLLVEGGRVQLQQVLLNLILNAADAMGEVAAQDRRLTIGTEIDGDNVRVRVADRGTGIAPENLKNVFEAFWTSKSGGIGVGLAICRSIISAHRGTLTAFNNPGGGATFCATWPIRQQA